MEGLSRTATGDAVPTATERVRRRHLRMREDPIFGWVSSLAVALLALLLRLWHLGDPKSFQFDETYYAKDAWSMLRYGHAQQYVEGADSRILAGDTLTQWGPDPSMAVHPEVGKWLIAVGEHFFGMDPFGWRISAAIVGSLMVLVMVRLARRLTGSTMLGIVAGLLLCFDGLQFVLSRLALLDIFQAFFILSAVTACVCDRDHLRRRLADAAERTTGRFRDPVYLWRPWLLVSGICWGLAVGTKWSSLPVLAAFGVLVWVWSSGARRSFGVKRSLLRGLVVDAPIAFVHLVLVAALVYTVSWTGWLLHASTYEEHLSDTQYTRFLSAQGCDQTLAPPGEKQWPSATEPDASGLGEVVQSLRSLAHYHHDVYMFHTHFLDCSEHTYESKPWGWLLLNRPVGVDAQLDIAPGQQGCAASPGSKCLRQVLLLGTPALWWIGLVALIFSAVSWLGRRDWRDGLIVVGVLTNWLPWFLNADRPIFIFYAVNIVPFTVLALTMLMGRMISGPVGSPRRLVGTIGAGTILLLVVLNFAYFWPIYTDGLLTMSEWNARIWFSRWI